MAAVSAAVILQEKPSNTTITPSNQQVQTLNQSDQINITIKTSGISATVQSAPNDTKVPKKMLAEMKSKARSDIQSYKSTVSSLKADMKTIAKRYNYTANITIISQFGTDKLPFIATVSGTSMLPTLNEGQGVIALKTKNFKVRDIVIARHPTYGLIIKRVAAIKNGKVFLKSDNRKVEVINTETPLSDGIVEITTVKKTPLDTWQPVKNIIGVVKVY